MNPARSILPEGAAPRSLTLRIAPHPKGDVFTLDRIERDGRSTSSSTVLYFDGTPRNFEDFECTGTQSSRRLDGDKVEILRHCGSAAWTRLIRRVSPKTSDLMLEITEQRTDGQHLDRRIMFEKQ